MSTNSITTKPEYQIDLSHFPDLSKAEVAPAELLGDYWTPEKEGESKRVLYLGLDEQSVIEPATGENRSLRIVKFLEQQGDDIRTIRNGSARLVGLFEQFANNIQTGSAFLITYLGKKKTNTGKFADNWSVKPLIIA